MRCLPAYVLFDCVAFRVDEIKGKRNSERSNDDDDDYFADDYLPAAFMFVRFNATSSKHVGTYKVQKKKRRGTGLVQPKTLFHFNREI